VNTRAALLSHRNELMARVRALDSGLADDLESVDKALEAISPTAGMSVRVAPNEFAELPIYGAAKLYLTRAKQSVPMPELVHALIAGGLKTKGERPSEWKISQSVAYHVSKGRLTLIAGRVGLPAE
jgi:hypothetical protein